MYNHEHETEKPNDKAPNKFLRDDYFHDGTIRSMEFDEKRSLRMSLVSARDRDEAYERIKGTEIEKERLNQL